MRTAIVPLRAKLCSLHGTTCTGCPSSTISAPYYTSLPLTQTTCMQPTKKELHRRRLLLEPCALHIPAPKPMCCASSLSVTSIDSRQHSLRSNVPMLAAKPHNTHAYHACCCIHSSPSCTRAASSWPWPSCGAGSVVMHPGTLQMPKNCS